MFIKPLAECPALKYLDISNCDEIRDDNVLDSFAALETVYGRYSYERYREIYREQWE
jgi:hypothetical protein